MIKTASKLRFYLCRSELGNINENTLDDIRHNTPRIRWLPDNPLVFIS